MSGVAVEIKGLKEAQRLLQTFPEETRKAHLRAVNKAAADAHVAAVRGVVETYTISVEAVVRDLHLVRASGNGATAMLKSSGRTRGLGNFDVTPKPSAFPWTSKRGYTATILRGQTKSFSKDYFWLASSSGHITLFRRVGGKNVYKKAESVSTPQMAGNPKVQERIERVTRETLERVFEVGMRKALERRIS